jgi:hypothetical protein
MHGGIICIHDDCDVIILAITFHHWMNCDEGHHGVVPYRIIGVVNLQDGEAGGDHHVWGLP